MIYYLNTLSNGGSGSNFKPLFENGAWALDDFSLSPSSQAPYGYEINQDGYIVSLSTYDSRRDSGFVIVPNDITGKYGVVFVINNDGGRAQYGRCQRNADAYACQASGAGRITYYDIGSSSQAGINLYAETMNSGEGEFIAFGKGISIIAIYYYTFL